MDALKKLQGRVEDRLRAERNKRAQRFQKLTEDVAKRFAEVEGNLLHEIYEQSKGSSMPRDGERLAQTLAQREPSFGAVPSLSSSAAPSVICDDTSVISGASDTGSRIMLIEQLKTKVERLENGLRSLVAVAKASANRRPDPMITDGAAAAAASVGRPVDNLSNLSNLSNMSGWSAPAGLTDQVHPWTTKLDHVESEMQVFSRRVTVLEVRMRAFEQQLDVRVHALIKQEINSLGLDRGR